MLSLYGAVVFMAHSRSLWLLSIGSVRSPSHLHSAIFKFFLKPIEKCDAKNGVAKFLSEKALVLWGGGEGEQSFSAGPKVWKNISAGPKA